MIDFTKKVHIVYAGFSMAVYIHGEKRWVGEKIDIFEMIDLAHTWGCHDVREWQEVCITDLDYAFEYLDSTLPDHWPWTLSELAEMNEMAYPKVMQYKKHPDLLILMNKEDCGIVIREYENHKVGDYREDWVHQNFQDYTGIVELSNDFIRGNNEN